MKEIDFEQKIVHGRMCHFYVPQITNEAKVPVVFVNDGEKVLSDIGEWVLEFKPKYMIVAINPIDRWDEYSPWAKKAPEGMGHDFGGKANDYLEWIRLKLIPYIENNYPVYNDFKHRAMCGYSFGALVANYSMLIEKTYGTILSCSASYWYPDFIEYMMANKLVEPYPVIYMSVGNKEGSEHIGKMTNTQVEKTKLAKNILENQLPDGNLTFVYHEGDHGDNVDERLQAALSWYGDYISEI